MAQIKQWNPGAAAVLSLIIPGAGQIYKGSIGTGILWLICVPLGYFMVIVPGIILHLICIYKAYSGNPYQDDPDAPSPSTHVKCPECRELVFKDAKICKHCGTKLIPQ